MITLVWLAASSLIWGGILYGAVIALQSRGELSGNARQWMWRGAALLLIAPWLAAPFVDVLAPGLTLSLPSGVEAIAAPAAAASVEAVLTGMPLGPTGMEPAVQERSGLVLPWIEIASGALLAGWIVRFGLARHAAFRMGRLLRSSKQARDGVGRDALDTWSRRLTLRRKPDLRLTAADISPFSFGALRPVICLPDGIEQKMRKEALGLVVGHECIHVARGDGWWRPAERAIADVLWFNPFAWAIRRELDVARELACDEAVVAACDARRAYARTLRDVAGMAASIPRSAPAASMSLSGGSRVLAMRMRRALASEQQRSGRAAIVGAVALAFAAVPAAVAQALLIEAVQPPDPPPAPAVAATAPAVPAVPAPPAVQIAPAPPVAAATPDPVAPSIPPEPPVPAVAPDPIAPAAPPAPSVPAAAPEPIAPPAPPEPPKAGIIKAEPGEELRLPFPARVVDVRDRSGGSWGFEATLVQTENSKSMEGCTAMLAGMTSLRVKDGDSIAAGAPIGVMGENPHVAISCQSMGGARVETRVGRTPTARVLGPLQASPAPLAPLAVQPRPGVMVLPRQSGAVVVPRGGLEPTRLLDAARPKLEGAPNAVLETNARKTRGFGYVETAENKTAFHAAVDLAARLDTPVHAPGAATVTFAGDKGGYGNVVELTFANEHKMRFAHLGEIRVKSGERVEPGQVIGTVGDDEFTTGPHLHFEYFHKGRAYDPEKVEGLILTRPG